MELSQLFKEYDEAFEHKNYQHKGMSEEEFSALALKSFLHITPQQQKNALNSWYQYMGSYKGLDTALFISTKTADRLPPEGTEEYKTLQNLVACLRFMCQTNLFFLCRLLGYSKVTATEHQWLNPQTKIWETHNTHEEICNEFFVQKDPANFATFEAFALDCDIKKMLKERLLLVPRGGFKSSINMADCVQWVTCFPEITIAVLTGKLDLAEDFVGEIKAHFTLDENFEKGGSYQKHRPRLIKNKLTGKLTTSMFQVLFPEHCVKPDEGKCTEFQTPACVAGDKEPTIRATGIEQTLAGSHFCVGKFDDAITEENSLTVTRMEDVNYRIGVDKALIHSFGFTDFIGTWYDERDYYGVQIAWDDKLFQAGEPNREMKIYRRAVWWPTEATIASGKVEAEWKPIDCIMWFPTQLTFEKMKASSQKEPEVFAIKYLNDPRQINKIKFPRELLIRRTLSHRLIPHQGIIVTAIDSAYSLANWADYTVIITALIYGGKFYILNMVRGRFNEYELPAVIAATGNTWKPKQMVIEDIMGTRFVLREIRNEMEKLKISIPIRPVSLGQGNKAHSKASKAKPVARLLGDERIYFMNSCEGLEEIYTEMSQFTGTTDDKHDDIVSAMSLLVEIFAPYAESASKVNLLETQSVADAQSFEMYQLIYGLGRYAETNAAFAADDNPRTQFDLGQAAEQMPTEDANSDPLSDLF
jgi:phage terminase large subunit-like protein